MNILFSEPEEYYRNLGLCKIDNFSYEFDGMRLYKKEKEWFQKYDLFVCLFYTNPHNVLLTLKFQELEKPTLLCSDGIFDFANSFINPAQLKYNVRLFHPVIQSSFLCVGKIESEYFSSAKINVTRFIPKRVMSVYDIIPLPEKNRVLVTTANSAYFNDSEYCLLVKSLTNVIEILEEKGILYSLRIFDKKLLIDLRQITSVNNDVKNDFEATLCRYSSVITTPSSIALTSMYHQRSTGLLVYRDYPMFLQTGWMIYARENFIDMLDGFVNRDKDRIDIQNHIIHGYISEKNLNDGILEALHADQEVRKIKYVDQNLLNMLNSKFNFNFEWFLRKVYLRVKKFKILNKIIIYSKKRLF